MSMSARSSRHGAHDRRVELSQYLGRLEVFMGPRPYCIPAGMQSSHKQVSTDASSHLLLIVLHDVFVREHT